MNCKLKSVNEKREEIVRWYCEEKQTMKVIGEKVGCSYATIRNRLIDWKVDIRPSSDYERKHRINLAGRVFGSLTAIKDVGKKHNTGRRMWYCECSCGGNKTTSTDMLLDGKTKGCQWCRAKYVGVICNSHWAKIICSISGRDMECGVTQQEMSDLFIQQNGRCALSGTKMILGKSTYDSTASIDRINSGVGYIISNCQWVDRRVNFMKRDYDENYYIEMCQRVAKWVNVKDEETRTALYVVDNRLKHGSWRGHGGISGQVWCVMLKTEKPFNVSIEQCWTLFLAQKGLCALTGTKLKFPDYGESPTTKTASLDRIDSRRGYEIDNIQWVHKDINFMKQDYSQDEFIFISRAVAEHANRKSTV